MDDVMQGKLVVVFRPSLSNPLWFFIEFSARIWFMLNSL